AIYMLYVFRKMFFMQKESQLETCSLHAREILSLIPIVVLIFYLGIAPKIFLDPLNKDADFIVEKMKERAIDDQTIRFLNHLEGENNVR
ncbi:NADH-quinone oxidoreductase subunit M, partial [Campylobacter coli]